MPKRTSRLEHLAQKEESATVKRIIFLSAISTIIGIFLLSLGLPLLGKFADILEIAFKKNETVDHSTSPDPPRLERLPAATNSAKLVISGFAQDETTVAIYLNSQKVGETKTIDGKFNYQDLILKDGKNEITAKSQNVVGKTSDSSQSQTIILDTTAPTLTVDTPSDGQSFSGDNHIKVTGKVDKDAQVFANGFLALVSQDGKFEVTIPLSEGENIIDIRAIDAAGNSKAETRKVNFHK